MIKITFNDDSIKEIDTDKVAVRNHGLFYFDKELLSDTGFLWDRIKRYSIVIEHSVTPEQVKIATDFQRVRSDKNPVNSRKLWGNVH